MNLRIITINLLLTTLSGGVLLQTLEAEAASVKFGQWTLNPATVTSSSFGSGSGNATPHTLKAAAVATVTFNPSSFGAENATTTVSLSNFFTVGPEAGEKNGDKVKGFLFGRLKGSLIGTGFDIGSLTGSFNTSVEASVDAGFQSFNKSDSNSASVLFLDASNKPVNVPFNKAGILTIGEQYPFNMSLTVSASKSGAYQALSKFDTTFTADVRAEKVPEPLTILGSATALGFGSLLKRKHSKKHKKS